MEFGIGEPLRVRELLRVWSVEVDVIPSFEAQRCVKKKRPSQSKHQRVDERESEIAESFHNCPHLLPFRSANRSLALPQFARLFVETNARNNVGLPPHLGSI